MKNNVPAKRIREMSESATIKMNQLSLDLKAQGHDVISLSLGEPDFDTPEHIKQAAHQALLDGYTKYTPIPGLVELRTAIADKFRRDNDLEFDIDQIVVSNGAKQCIANLCLSLLNPGDEVIIFTPYWVSYFEIVRLAGGVPVLLSASVEEDFKVNPDQLQNVLTKRTRAVLFSSPCNPTGSVYSEQELTALADVLTSRKDIVIIADEIYEYINFTERHFSIGSLPQVSDQTVTVNGFSKGFAMTGWRLGYMAGPKWLAKACAKIQGQFTSGASSFGQKAASVALQSDLGPTREMKNQFIRRKELIKTLLAQIPSLICNDPKGAFYIFPDVSSYFGKSAGDEEISNADDLAMFILKKAHVGVVSGSAFGDPNCIRISYAASDADLKTAIDRIARSLATLK